MCSCETEPRSPEEEVRSLVEQAEAHAEVRDVPALKHLVSERYLDERGFNRESIGALMAYYLSAHETVHLLTRVEGLTVDSSGRAAVTLLVGMAGSPLEKADDLAQLRADLFRFDLTLVLEDDQQWRVMRAHWQRAQPGDFF